jgi:hypothetical protein
LVAVPLEGCRFVRPLGIIQRRQHQLSSTATRFLRLLRKSGTTAKRTEAGMVARGNGARHHTRRTTSSPRASQTAF